MNGTDGRSRATKALRPSTKSKSEPATSVAPQAPSATTLPPTSAVRRLKQGPARILPRTRPADSEATLPKVVAPTVDETTIELEFGVGEVIVHPSHGVGRVAGIEEKSFGGTPTVVYVLDILGTGLKVLIPKPTASRVGLRRVMSKGEAEEILVILRTSEVAVNIQPWNRRFRAYSEMMATGAPKEIAKVLRDMQRLKSDKELSFGERRLLEQSKTLLVMELGLALGLEGSETEALVSEIFGSKTPSLLPPS